jgi:hypothetical protein
MDEAVGATSNNVLHYTHDRLMSTFKWSIFVVHTRGVPCKPQVRTQLRQQELRASLEERAGSAEFFTTTFYVYVPSLVYIMHYVI